jgi:hypothetical protein
MTKQTNEPIDLPNGSAPLLNDTEPQAPPVSSDRQLSAFQDLARRMSTDRSIQRFNAALRTLLLPVRKRAEAKARPPTHSPES